VALEQLSVLEAIERLQSLLQESTNDKEQAAVHYEIWRLDNQQEEAGQSAAELYQNLYSKTPDILYGRRYEELTGQTLPASLPLPALPEIITSPPVDLEALMRQVDHFIAQL
jgi:hypothetical protein